MHASRQVKRMVALLALALGLRAIHGMAPLLGTNSWRQCDNAAIARNYTRHGYRFLEPRVDWGGDRAGIVQMEFPVYQYAVALLYRVFGEHDWFGRWISIACSLGATWCLARLALRILGPGSYAWAAFFMATLPLYIYYSRAFMVESALLLCMTGGVLAFDIWLERGRPVALVTAAVAVALGGLLKPVALAVGLPLLVLAWGRFGSRALRHPGLLAFAVATLLPAALWYSWSANLLARDHLTLLGDWRYGTDKWGNWELALSWKFWNRVLFVRLAEKHITWPGFVLLVAGLLLPRHSPRERVFAAWLAAAAIASAIAAPGAFQHEHYQLWFIPPAAALMAKAVAVKFRKRFWVTWTTAVVGLALAAYVPAAAWRYTAVCDLERTDESTAWRVAQLLAARTEPDALVVAVDNHDPTDLYHARRRGWGVHVNELMENAEAILKDRAARGARYLVAPHAFFVDESLTVLVRNLRLRHSLVVDDGAVFIVRLGPAPQPRRTR